MKHLICGIIASLLLTACPDTRVVTHVYDGDTLTLANGDKVRLIGIDAPEKAWAKKKIAQECYAEESAAVLRGLVEGKRVRLEKDDTQPARDKYGRRLAYVYLGNTLVNHAMLEAGAAYAYTYFPFSKSAEFQTAHAAAREQQRGMWGACAVTCEWKFCEIAPR